MSDVKDIEYIIVGAYCVVMLVVGGWGLFRYLQSRRPSALGQSLLAGVGTVHDLWRMEATNARRACAVCAFDNAEAAAYCLLCGVATDVVSLEEVAPTTSAEHRLDWQREVLVGGQHRWRKHRTTQETNARHFVARPTPGGNLVVESVAAFNARQPDGEATVASLSFARKYQSFLEAVARLKAGHRYTFTSIRSARDATALVQSTSSCLAKLSIADLHKPFSVRFEREPGIDAGGLEREWYSLVATALFNPHAGFFTATDAHCLELAATQDPVVRRCPKALHDESSQWYRGIGRFVGRALYDGHPIPARFNVVLFKQLLGAPFGLDDLRFVDAAVFASLRWIDSHEDVAALALDFRYEPRPTSNAMGLGSVLEREADGTAHIVDLTPGGRDVVVTAENKASFVAAYVQYRCAARVQAALAAFVAGVHDVLPLAILSVFDHEELRLVLCGIDIIDVDDWQAHTYLYGGPAAARGEMTVAWFWAIVRSMEHAQRAKLLQFVTGSYCVPFQGFRGLTNRDGVLCHFTLRVVSLAEAAYPVAHTCCNRLDLPRYKNKATLKRALTLVAAMDVTGFSMA
ncbi:HECT E3 ubiquitin ligase [Achlya hypogyna]|uniref:HECT-type E3 ubiquitin transferase n=1 Tax=Achlya hypogyna TaxID=1202772 RepID=A0A1V9YZJ6_ACHHY|nr:HECT E3 ubiquitin ligase [Achlya hypogyna]